MEPAPGYDDCLPHDMAHFIVESELGITGGVFGQLAAGGTAGTFHPVDPEKRRKIARRSKRISAGSREDALLSEKAVALACAKWNKDPIVPTDTAGISEREVERICSIFDEVSRRWSGLEVGGSITLEWRQRRDR